MTLWRRTRNEAAGAWRSLRYDLGRREPGRHAPPRRGARRGAAYQDVTSTGLHTFGGSGSLRPYAQGGPDVHRTRRLVAVTALGTLAVVGVAGGYFAVIGGVGPLTGAETAGVEPYPLVAEGPRGSERERSNSGLGRGTAEAPDPAPTPASPNAVVIAPTRDTVAVVPVPGVTTPTPRQTTVDSPPPSTEPTDCCMSPPVPTPYEPAPSESPSASPSESPGPSDSPSPSATPEPAVPSATGEPQHPARPNATASHTR
jgi:hypothetical protein